MLALAGCGGGDDDEGPARTTTTAPAAGAAAYHKVADDMRDIGALAAGECANEAAIRRAMRRLEQDAAQLPDTAQGAEAQQLVDEVLADTRETLRSCP